MTQTARGEFVVSLKPLAFEGADPEFKLARMSIDKQISGDLTASTLGQMLTAMTGTDGSAGYVAIERVVGVLDGKQGTFVLQHSGTMHRGTPSLVVTVVPDFLKNCKTSPWRQNASAGSRTHASSRCCMVARK